MPQRSKTRNHFYAISHGHCHPSLFSSWHDASPMVTGCPGARHKGFNTVSDAREWMKDSGHDTFHFCQGPADGDKTQTNEHKGRPSYYVATNGQNAAIFEDYSDVKVYVDGCKNSTQKSYADLKTATAVLQELNHLDGDDDMGKLDKRRSSDGEEGDLVAGMASVSL